MASCDPTLIYCGERDPRRFTPEEPTAYSASSNRCCKSPVCKKIACSGCFWITYDNVYGQDYGYDAYVDCTDKSIRWILGYQNPPVAPATQCGWHRRDGLGLKWKDGLFLRPEIWPECEDGVLEMHLRIFCGGIEVYHERVTILPAECWEFDITWTNVNPDGSYIFLPSRDCPNLPVTYDPACEAISEFRFKNIPLKQMGTVTVDPEDYPCDLSKSDGCEPFCDGCPCFSDCECISWQESDEYCMGEGNTWSGSLVWDICGDYDPYPTSSPFEIRWGKGYGTDDCKLRLVFEPDPALGIVDSTGAAITEITIWQDNEAACPDVEVEWDLLNYIHPSDPDQTFKPFSFAATGILFSNITMVPSYCDDCGGTSTECCPAGQTAPDSVRITVFEGNCLGSGPTDCQPCCMEDGEEIILSRQPLCTETAGTSACPPGGFPTIPTTPQVWYKGTSTGCLSGTEFCWALLCNSVVPAGSGPCAQPGWTLYLVGNLSGAHEWFCSETCEPGLVHFRQNSLMVEAEYELECPSSLGMNWSYAVEFLNA